MMSPDGERKAPPFARIATAAVVVVVAALVEGLDGGSADVVVVGLVDVDVDVDVVADRLFAMALLEAEGTDGPQVARASAKLSAAPAASSLRGCTGPA